MVILMWPIVAGIMHQMKPVSFATLISDRLLNSGIQLDFKREAVV